MRSDCAFIDLLSQVHIGEHNRNLQTDILELLQLNTTYTGLQFGYDDVFGSPAERNCRRPVHRPTDRDVPASGRGMRAAGSRGRIAEAGAGLCRPGDCVGRRTGCACRRLPAGTKRLERNPLKSNHPSTL
jgi:hypothetical protein